MRATSTGVGLDCATTGNFPTTERCWNVWQNVTTAVQLCDPNFGQLKAQRLTFDRFTGAECGCNDDGRGDGYECYSTCMPSDQAQVSCKPGQVCVLDGNLRPTCGCPFGLRLDASGKCQPIPNPCDTCKHNCHKASKCRNVANVNEGWTFSCEPCDESLGYRGNGRTCYNIDECAENKHNCDPRAQCVDKQPIFDNSTKYRCVCSAGWQGDAMGGTLCRPCQDTDECLVTPNICGSNAKCTNTPGSYQCSCLPGFKKDNKGDCVDQNECTESSSPLCDRWATCNNTIGSYSCHCNVGYMGDGHTCKPNPDYFCRNCDTNSTICQLNAKGDAYSCECKKYFNRVTAEKCTPTTYCDKPTKNDCAPAAVATCTDRANGSGFDCKCKASYQGNGRKCEPIDVCERETPCATVPNTKCVSNVQQPSTKYTCQCKPGFVRELADVNNPTAPCYDVNTSPVNNCSLCLPHKEVCRAEPGSDYLKSCVCADGYKRAGNGQCENKNECTTGESNCDRNRAVCIDLEPALDVPKHRRYECVCKNGFDGSGTTGDCHDIDECDLYKSTICQRPHQICQNTIGSYQCTCDKGYAMIKGRNLCADQDECALGTYTCSPNAHCRNVPGSYVCDCNAGYQPNGTTDSSGQPICQNVNECVAGMNGDPTRLPCDRTVSDCHDTSGSVECICHKGYVKDAHDPELCRDIDECALKIDHCDPTTTVCRNVPGGYACDCLHGFVPSNLSSLRCVDQDECRLRLFDCDPHADCVNLIPSYKCVCKDGYVPESNTHPLRPQCKHVNPCTASPGAAQVLCGPGGVCSPTDQAPWYRCECLSAGAINYNDTTCLSPTFCNENFPCPPNAHCINGQCGCVRGYAWTPLNPITMDSIRNKRACQPINPCDDTVNPVCPKTQRCSMTGPGSYNCSCNAGFKMNAAQECVDVDECQITPSVCEKYPLSRCHNYPGYYTCKCDEGTFLRNAASRNAAKQPDCAYITYCDQHLDNCSSIANSHCVNLSPGFRCDCNKGYAYQPSDPTQCSDIDECKTLPNACPTHARCVNTPGSFQCLCLAGYRGPGCPDIDECAEGSDNCDPFTQNCQNTIGSYRCKCKTGYSPQGSICVEIDECANPTLNNCSSRSPSTGGMLCKNTKGGYYCSCPTGYELAPGSDSQCNQIDYCQWHPCPQSNGDTCVNTPGGFKCDCLHGYRKPASCADKPNTCQCENVDECTEGVDDKPACGAHAICKDLPGAWSCSCRAGYQGNAFVNCTLIDACQNEPCGSPAKGHGCRQVDLGEHECFCLPGYLRKGRDCVPDPCFTNSGDCGATSTCLAWINDVTGALNKTCACPTPKIYDDVEKRCVDPDVCGCGDVRKEPCRSIACPTQNFLCRSHGAHVKCYCPPGYELAPNSRDCQDKDECVEGLDDGHPACGPDANCTNTVGSYVCRCPRGERVTVDGQCIPDTGCSLEAFCSQDSNADCRPNAYNPKQIYCQCKAGFSGTGLPTDPPCKHIDWCLDFQQRNDNRSACNPVTEFCVPGELSYSCQCRPGFRWNDKSCSDRDECVDNPQACTPPFVCRNTFGSFACDCPNATHQFVNGQCLPIDHCKFNNPCNPVTEMCVPLTGGCQCRAGFQPSSSSSSSSSSSGHQTTPQVNVCVDTDECATFTYNCPSKSRCQNTVGSYRCVCQDGFAPTYAAEDNTTLLSCHDIDECVVTPNVCPAGISTCHNTEGNYRCECIAPALPRGPHDCVVNSTIGCDKCAPQHAHCLKSPLTGTYNCSCDLGFQGDAAVSCSNVDECALGLADCNVNATCHDLTPLYECICKPPMIGDGHRQCHYPEFCASATYNDCPSGAQCVALSEASPQGKWVTCVCTQPGFRFNNSTRSCEDVDECAECHAYSNCPCPKDATQCLNREGDFTCKCAQGYRYNAKTNACDDVDECKEGLYQTACPPTGGTCRNLLGGFACDCKPGYAQRSGDATRCDRDLFCGVKDQCDRNTTTCQDLAVGYQCTCLSGLQPVPMSSYVCEDVNECKENLNNCTALTEQCVNEWRGFKCDCKSGFLRDQIGGVCTPEQTCTKECGAYGLCVLDPRSEQPSCICQTGYYMSPLGCVVSPPCQHDFDCPSNAKCVVVQAQNSTDASVGTYDCLCNSGYTRKGWQCWPQTPCTDSPGICGASAACVPTTVAPFYACECAAGAVKSTTNGSCTVPTCATTGATTCGPNADCHDRSDGTGFYCQCKPGFNGVGTVLSPCKPTDPCRDNRPCSKFATCSNKPEGKYECTCNAGYAGNGTYCFDQDECALDTDDCDTNALCTNTQGSFQCACAPGFTGSGKRGGCQDSNECKDPALNGCDPQTTVCNNTIGGYDCLCLPGFQRLSGASRLSCTDIKECANRTICGQHKCVEQIGSYSCSCGGGYKQDPSDQRFCLDINECTFSDTSPCNRFANCENADGSFSCTCRDGYTGDGITGCTPIDKCKNGDNKCNNETSTCRMLPDQPAYQCDCLPGFQKNPLKTGINNECIDVDECQTLAKQIAANNASCVNEPGTYTLTCQPGYVPANAHAPNSELVCVNQNPCSQDPAWQQSIDKYAGLTASQLSAGWTVNLVPPQRNDSAYAYCYALAIQGKRVIDQPGATVLPFCRNIDPPSTSDWFYTMTSSSGRLTLGFECDCPPGVVRHDEEIFAGVFYIPSCPSDTCPNCRIDYNYICKAAKCVCKPGYTERVDTDGITKCLDWECESGTRLPSALTTQENNNIYCDTTTHRWTAKTGFRLERDNTTGQVVHVVDIDECAETPDVCCAQPSSCVGDLCLSCFNTYGSYVCRGAHNSVCTKPNRDTCQCQATQCPTETTWYYDCSGCDASALSALDNITQVCSALLSPLTKQFVTYPSLRALMTDVCANFDPTKLACAFDISGANPRTSPIYNYDGPCQSQASAIKCPGGAVPNSASLYGTQLYRCPIATSPGYPSVQPGSPLNHNVTNDCGPATQQLFIQMGSTYSTILTTTPWSH